MSRNSHSIELEISAYWNALVAQDEPLPPISDSELAQLIEAIQRSEDSEAPAADFTNRLIESIALQKPSPRTPESPIPLSLWPEAARTSPSLAARPRWAIWLAAALAVAIVGLSLVLWLDGPSGPDEPPPIPAAMPGDETGQPVESRSTQHELARLSVDPDRISPGARETWTAASFRMFEIPAGSYYQFPDCPGCAVLVVVTVTEGSMDLRIEGPVATSNQSSSTVYHSTSEQSVSLANNDSAVFDLQSVLELRALANDGEEPATLLVGFLYGEDFAVAAGGGTPPNLFSSVWTLPSLGDGNIELGIDRFEIGPTSSFEMMSSAQPALYLLEEGRLTIPVSDNGGTPTSWKGPVGVQLEKLPAGVYELANAGPGEAVLYRMTLSGAQARPDGSPALED
jgi:hypothetical protein